MTLEGKIPIFYLILLWISGVSLVQERMLISQPETTMQVVWTWALFVDNAWGFDNL